MSTGAIARSSKAHSNHTDTNKPIKLLFVVGFDQNVCINAVPFSLHAEEEYDPVLIGIHFIPIFIS